MPDVGVSRHVEVMSMRGICYLDIVWVEFDGSVGILNSVAVLFKFDVCLWNS